MQKMVSVLFESAYYVKCDKVKSNLHDFHTCKRRVHAWELGEKRARRKRRSARQRLPTIVGGGGGGGVAAPDVKPTFSYFVSYRKFVWRSFPGTGTDKLSSCHGSTSRVYFVRVLVAISCDSFPTRSPPDRVS